MYRLARGIAAASFVCVAFAGCCVAWLAACPSIRRGGLVGLTIDPALVAYVFTLREGD